jgi:rubredoxin
MMDDGDAGLDLKPALDPNRTLWKFWITQIGRKWTTAMDHSPSQFRHLLVSIAANPRASMNDSPPDTAAPKLTTWLCVICGFFYSEEAGSRSEGIAAGARWHDVPEDWLCPECRVAKTDFEMVKV